ncbi:MAG: GAF domain-containing sensor histidine kinase [Chroococcidiopsidaceae cyanobacterium CP_BM_RX_35]|nr:GAF domain-containing sensor histidine kinase [Chroococcidiopsidaceae cyanobacterium CP_BM_RX_35]
MTNFSRCRHIVHVNQSALRNIPVIPMQQQTETAPLAQQINQIVSDSSEPATMMQQISQTIGESFQLDCCIITLQKRNPDQAQTAHWYFGNQSSVSLQPEMLALKQLASLISAGAGTIVINDTLTTKNSPDWEHLLLPVRAVLQIPVRFQGKISGLILLMQREPHRWTDTEIERAQAIASPVAIAISQVEKTALIATLQQQFALAAQYQTLTNKLVIASRGSLELQQFLQLAIAGAAQTLGVEHSSLLLLKYTDPLLESRNRQAQMPKAKVTVVCEWLNTDKWSEREISPLSQPFWLSECCLCQQAFQDAPKPVAIVDIHDSPAINLAGDVAPIFQLSQTAGILLFPLESQGTVLGFLVLQHSSPRLWHPEELALLELVSAQVSGVIIRNQTLRQVQALVEKRTVQLQSSLEIQAKLYEKTRQQIDQLRYLNQLKDEFLSNVNHELRTPLTSMSVAIRLLRQPNLPTETQTKYLDILEQQCVQEIKLINDLLQLQELQSEQVSLQMETIDLKLKVRELVQSFEVKWADKGLTAQVELPKVSLLLATEVDSLDRILQELHTNAGKYSNPNTTIDLKVDEQVDRVIFSLTNIGPNISPEEASQLFDKFRRGRGVTQQAIQGTGLGLALVKCLVQHLNGTIDVDVSRCPDSYANMSKICFILTLPKFFEPQP